MKDLFHQILSKHGRSKYDVKHAIGSIGISMKEIATSDGFNNRIFQSESSSSSENKLDTRMKQLIDSHKNSFLPQKIPLFQ